jgi:hypothetical protein
LSKIVYWMSVSLDGFVETRDGKIDWTAAGEAGRTTDPLRPGR